MAAEESTELLSEPAPTSKESAKIIAPKEEEEKLTIKRWILIIIGYSALIFMLLSLFFPFWTDYTAVNYRFLSLWRIKFASSPLPLYHWDIFFQYMIFPQYIFPSALILFLLSMIIFKLAKRVWNLVMHDWKEPSPGTASLWIAIILFALTILFSFLPEFNLSGYSNYVTILYGPSWGLSFGWYSLLIAGILGRIYNKYAELLEKPKEEDWKGL